MRDEWFALFGGFVNIVEAFSVEADATKQDFLRRNHPDTCRLFGDVKDLHSLSDNRADWWNSRTALIQLVLGSGKRAHHH